VVLDNFSVLDTVIGILNYWYDNVARNEKCVIDVHLWYVDGDPVKPHV
jgi:hypothetical protein